MDILLYFLIIVEVICCLLLIGVILLQQSKSQGMGVAFGGGMGETLFGSRAGNILTKTTVTLAIIFLANTTLLGIIYTTGDEQSLVESAPIAAPMPIAAPAPTGNEMMSQPDQGTMFQTFDPGASAPMFSTETTSESAPVEPVVMPVAVDEPTAEPVSP